MVRVLQKWSRYLPCQFISQKVTKNWSGKTIGWELKVHFPFSIIFLQHILKILQWFYVYILMDNPTKMFSQYAGGNGFGSLNRNSNLSIPSPFSSGLAAPVTNQFPFPTENVCSSTLVEVPNLNRHQCTACGCIKMNVSQISFSSWFLTKFSITSYCNVM